MLFTEEIGKFIFKIIRKLKDEKLMKYKAVDANDVASLMIKIVKLEIEGTRIFETHEFISKKN